jgi:uncharacterized membrane protein YhiD involved in acid resistance
MHMLVGTGAAAFVGTALLNTHAWTLGDVNQVAAGVATGVGFLGAGTITKKGNEVTGLTTATGIWLVAANGYDVANAYWIANNAHGSNGSFWILILPIATFLDRLEAKVFWPAIGGGNRSQSR